jgi:general secretion pathway protein G
MHTIMQIRNRRGFTLVELLIVIIIVAVLAAVAIPKFANHTVKGKEASIKANLKTYRNAVELFRNDTGLFPLTLDDLTLETAPTNGLTPGTGTSVAIPSGSWRGPYLQRVEKDAVSGSDFAYTTSGVNTGMVKPSASGTASDGTNYNTW